jgi:hypothetical protein
MGNIVRIGIDEVGAVWMSENLAKNLEHNAIKNIIN